MKHFGNSLSYEELIEDMKICAKMNKKEQPKYYTGEQVIKSNVGEYINGVFHQTGTRETKFEYSIKFIELNNKWFLSAKNDGGYFDTLTQAKNAARRAFGNGIKWKPIL